MQKATKEQSEPKKFPHPIRVNDHKERSAANGTGKFPLRGRAGYLARQKLAEEKGDPIRVNDRQGRSASNGTSTSWGNVATWYHETVEDKASYQKDLIMPNLLRLMDIKKGEVILDLACGEGMFARRYAKSGALVIGVDIAKELIEIAKKASPEIRYYVSGAENLPFIADASVDMVTIILALQNIENVSGVFKECARVLKPHGKLFIALNHPAFRVLKESSWGWDLKGNPSSAEASLGTNPSGSAVQYRRVDAYLSESRTKIQMHPGDTSSETTISFHRPLQYFVKLLGKAGLGVVNMEEWVSNKISQPGPRATAEDRARKEIPLFMALHIVKL